jgi:hypothetical protein
MTGTMTVLVIIGLAFTAVTAFRTLAGRLGDTEILAAHALYWYFTAARVRGRVVRRLRHQVS